MKFGQYELLEPIAIGGMAEVFKGRVVAAEGFEKYVAIKRILPDLAADERFVKMLLTEARIHSALSHRNIVQIHDLGISEGGEYFIVLEYVEGYDLRVITDQLGRENEIIPEALSLYIAAEIADGLHFAHEMRGPDGQTLGLVHRDVTPSNVLISYAGEVKLSDFGLAKRRHDHSVVGSLKGNLAYMSPEQAMQAPLDRRTDIYSLGAMLYEMITGRRLREITDEIAGWSQVASGVVPSARRVRPDLPVPIERLLDTALAADPANRFPDAAKFGSAIREVLSSLNMPVGASDLAALLGAIEPPRRPRTIMMEPSKVIRLGSEAAALGEAIAAPQTPAPVLAPGLTPAAPKATDRQARYRDPAATPMVEVHPPKESKDPMATPPPAAPLPPARVRGYTPRPPTGAPAPRPRSVTPPLGAPPMPRPTSDRLRVTPHVPHPAADIPRATPAAGTRAPRPGAADMPATPPASAHAPRPGTDLRMTPAPGARVPRPGADIPNMTPAAGTRVPRPGADIPRTTPGSGTRAPRPGAAIPYTTPAVGTRAPRPDPVFPPATPPTGNRDARLTPPAGLNVGGAGSRRVPGAAIPGRAPAGPSRPMTSTPALGVSPMAPQPVAASPSRPLRGSAPDSSPGSRGPMFRTPSYGVKRPSGRVVAVGGDGAPAGAPRAQPLSYNPSREHHQTARVQLKSSGGLRGGIAALVVLGIAAAAIVHFVFVPLDVLATWWAPAALSIATDPNGASLSVDGVPLGAPTPVTISVMRDRADHVVEAQLPGFRSARAIMRYDRSLGLSFLLPLEKDPAAAPPVPPTAPRVAGSPDAGY